MKKGFVHRQNPEHWLGNGIYFYFDYSLAEWWATKPTRRFGHEIKNKCILTTTLSINRDKILDLRRLEDYQDCVFAFHTFNSKIVPRLEEDTIHNRDKLRCAFFDWLFDAYTIDCIIGSFTHDGKAYLNTMPFADLERLKIFDLPYVETQICVREGLIEPTAVSRVKEGETK